MNDDFAVNFLPVFAGVLISFSLWFLGEHIMKWRAQRKDREAMTGEIVEEAKFNILALECRLDFVKKRLDGSGDTPMSLPRLRTSASSYAISSGTIRLLKSRRKRFLVRYMNEIYERENRFAENTEQLFAILLLRKDGLTWVNYRLTRIAEATPQTISRLTDFLDKFQQKNLPEDTKLDDWVRTPMQT
jgi:hypothetical protein